MDRKTIVVTLIFMLLLFGIPWAWRRYRDKDIENNKKYAIGKVTKLLGSLKNGEQFYYNFCYDKTIYTGYRSSHVDYDVNVGDFFLVNFSSLDPSHSRMLYEYKVRDSTFANRYINITWDTIPKSILKSGRKKDNR